MKFQDSEQGKQYIRNKVDQTKKQKTRLNEKVDYHKSKAIIQEPDNL